MPYHIKVPLYQYYQWFTPYDGQHLLLLSFSDFTGWARVTIVELLINESAWLKMILDMVQCMSSHVSCLSISILPPPVFLSMMGQSHIVIDPIPCQDCTWWFRFAQPCKNLFPFYWSHWSLSTLISLMLCPLQTPLSRSQVQNGTVSAAQACWSVYWLPCHPVFISYLVLWYCLYCFAARSMFESVNIWGTVLSGRPRSGSCACTRSAVDAWRKCRSKRSSRKVRRTTLISKPSGAPKLKSLTGVHVGWTMQPIQPQLQISRRDSTSHQGQLWYWYFEILSQAEPCFNSHSIESFLREIRTGTPTCDMAWRTDRSWVLIPILWQNTFCCTGTKTCDVWSDSIWDIWYWHWYWHRHRHWR